MGWLTEWRRKRVLQKHRMDEALWRAATRGFAFIQKLSSPQESKLKDLVLLFLADKQFTGARGFEVTDPIRLSIAAQACLPILELGLDWYSGWSGIVVYPGDFRVRRSEVDEDGVLHEWDDELAGEAMPGGPVVLSWDAAAHDSKMNVVLHEFAHQLDGQDGAMDGTPKLGSRGERDEWARVFNDAYYAFERAAASNRPTLVDAYGAGDPAEFFAVVTESFFERPLALRREHAALYDVLARYYRVDPASWESSNSGETAAPRRRRARRRRSTARPR